MTSDVRERLVSAATNLMLRQGYSATGINSICDDAGVSKGAFYHFFRSKEELAVAALENFFRRALDRLRTIDVSDAPPAERLPLFVEGLAERAEDLWQNGCMIGELATEMAEANDELQRHVARQFDELSAAVGTLAKPYVHALPISGVSAKAVAEDLLAFIEGAVVLSRAHRDPGLLRPRLRRYATLLRALAGSRSVPPKKSRRD